MGTEVECKNSFLGYYSTRDLNDEANGVRWPLYYDHKKLKSREYYSSFCPRPATDGYSEYDKEVLKQTMLKHEAIFRNQVSELHRLYRIQRDLMDELKRKELHKYPIPLEASQANPLSSQMLPEDSRRVWHVPSILLGKSTSSRPSGSGDVNMQSPLKFIKECCMQSDPSPTQNGVTFKNCEVLESKFIKLQRRTLDLQLPAKEYIDSEEVECIKEEKDSLESVVENYALKRNCEVAPDSDIKLSLSSDWNPGCIRYAAKPDSCLLNKHSLVDLNEPIHVEEATSLTPANNCFRPVPCHTEFQGKDLPVKKKSGIPMPKEFLQNTQKSLDNGTHIGVQHFENEGSKQEWSSYYLEAGQSRSKLNSFSRGFYTDKSPTSSKPIQAELKKPRELPAFLLADQTNREPWKESANSGMEISIRNQSLCNYDFLGPIEVANYESPSVSLWRNLMSSLSQNPSLGFIADKWHRSSNLGSSSTFGSEGSCQNGFCHDPQLEPKAPLVHVPSVGFTYLNSSNDKTSGTEHFDGHSPTKYFKGSDCVDVKCTKEINLNLALPNGFQGLASQRDLVIIDGEGRNEEYPSGSLPWLRTKPACNDRPTKGRDDPNQDGSGLFQVQQLAHKIEEERVPTPCACDSEDQRIEHGNCPSSKRIFGFSVFEESDISKNQSSLTSLFKSLQCPSESEAIQKGEVGLLNIDSSHKPALPDSCQNLSTENLAVLEELGKDLSGLKNHINLNSCANEEEGLSTCTIQRATEMIVPKIYLEAPIVTEIAEGNQLVSTIQSSQVEVLDTSEEIIKIVAEAIVIMSSSYDHSHFEDEICHPLEASLSESLHWLAEIILSNAGDSKEGVISRGKFSGNRGESSSDEIDYFESMTLKLTQTKVDEYCCKPQAPENQREEEMDDSRLPTLRRKGLARGRKQRDFQRDILPGLASLSRHEVTEDLQTFGGLMRATGHPWQTGLARRSAARNGWARGRGQSQGPSPVVPASTMCSLPRQQPINCELGLKEGSLKGWGRKTRRQHYQRNMIGNLPIPPTQV